MDNNTAIRADARAIPVCPMVFEGGGGAKDTFRDLSRRNDLMVTWDTVGW